MTVVTSRHSECSDAVTTFSKAAAVVGRTLLDVGRYGKLFYLTLDGPKHPVLHLGMTGAIQVSNHAYARGPIERRLHRSKERTHCITVGNRKVVRQVGLLGS